MFIYFDFKYRGNTKAEEIILLSYVLSTDKKLRLIDLRQPNSKHRIKQLIIELKGYIWVTFDAEAALSCFLTLGINISNFEIIDAMVEAKMVSLTHNDYHSTNHDLNSTLRRFKVPLPCSSQFREETLDIISGKDNYTERLWCQIRVFGPMNVTPLPALLNEIWSVHESTGTNIDLNEMVNRGEYIKAFTQANHQSIGFEIDRNLLAGIFANRVDFLREMQLKINNVYGRLYIDKGKEKQMVWNHSNFAKLINSYEIPWMSTESGRQLDTSTTYFKEQSRRYHQIIPLYHIRRTVDAMRSTDLRQLEKNGRIKPQSLTFQQKTGRNSPQPSKGFLLNLPPWMRALIKPSKGKVVIGIDWGQQEIAIAAALSGDKRYLDAYNTKDGDVYLALAKMAGAVPSNATKESHSIERQTFKAVQLGLGYGKGLRSLAADVYAANRTENGQYLITPSEAEDKAEFILNWHKANFFEYWDWINDTVEKARIDGYLKSLDGWTYFVDKNVRNTQLLNFPMQANGAAMMRLAVINAAKMNTFDLVCTLHDALYANSEVQNKEKTIKEVVSCMDNACMELLDGAVKIRTDVSIYDEFTGYQDPRGQEMLQQVRNYIRSKG
jgi:DNA polymerase-1